MTVTTVADLSARHLGHTIRCNGYQGSLDSIGMSDDPGYPIALVIDGRHAAWVKLDQPAEVVCGCADCQPVVPAWVPCDPDLDLDADLFAPIVAEVRRFEDAAEREADRFDRGQTA